MTFMVTDGLPVQSRRRLPRHPRGHPQRRPVRANLHQLGADHRGRTTFFYFDVPFSETVRRHTTRPQASEFTPEDMRGWYATSGRLGMPDEQIIASSSSVDVSVARIMVHMDGE
ncbi:hypothetical protein [Amycolatopsis plumensis]|uniref:Uncharacterized protein n=1 Tax=Amycolatopsis plumensis TaxID=236508 RepID=A0ABV5U845_9PSEU